MWETIQSGGPLIVPLILCGILAIAYTVERLWVLGKLPDPDAAQSELERLEQALKNNGQEAAADECNQGRGVLNYVFAALIRRHNTLEIEQREFKDTHDEIMRLAELGGGGDIGRFMVMQQELIDHKAELVIETEGATRSYLGKNLPILNTIGNISPLIGLLGTITGMIVAFESIASSGAGDPKVVAGGISQALVTTATGLVVAIPSIISYRYLARKADRSLELLEVYGHAFANALIMHSRQRKDA
jgi:biopolymer transport protein ExbB